MAARVSALFEAKRVIFVVKLLICRCRHHNSRWNVIPFTLTRDERCCICNGGVTSVQSNLAEGRIADLRLQMVSSDLDPHVIHRSLD